MGISEFSVIMSIACSSVILFAAGFLVSHTKRVRWGLISLIILLGVARLVFPMEFWGAKEIMIWKAYHDLHTLVHSNLIGDISFGGLLLLIWGAGLVFLILRFWHQIRIIKDIEGRAIPVIEKDDLYRICMEAVKEVGYDGKVSLAVTKKLDTAVSIGFLSPRILIPEEMLSYTEMELKGVLKHEVTHYLRGDIAKQRMLIFMQCLFWWNPVFYYLRKCVEGMLELECDERACTGMTEEERIAYLDAITKVLKAGRDRSLPMGLGWNGKFTNSFLLRRYKEVLEPVKRQSNAVTYVLAFVCLVLFLLSYSVIAQPGTKPVEEDRQEVSGDMIWKESDEDEEFLIKLPDGTYLFVSGMLGKTILSPEEVLEAPYVDLPVYDGVSKGD